MHYLLLLIALLYSAPALAKSITSNARFGMSPMITGIRALDVNGVPRLAATGTIAGRSLTVNRATVQLDRVGRVMHIGSVGRNPFGGEMGGGAVNILTGTNRRIDILTGRPID